MFLLRFREPRLHEVAEHRSLGQHLAVTVRTVRRQARLLPIAVLLVLTALLTQAVFEFGPLWLVDADASAGSFGPAWAALMASLGLSGLLAGRVQFERWPALAIVSAVLIAAGVTLPGRPQRGHRHRRAGGPRLLAIAIGIYLTRLLHDAIPSDIRSGVSSTVGAAGWLVFLPFSLDFGSVSERWGVHGRVDDPRRRRRHRRAPRHRRRRCPPGDGTVRRAVPAATSSPSTPHARGAGRGVRRVDRGAAQLPATGATSTSNADSSGSISTPSPETSSELRSDGRNL